MPGLPVSLATGSIGSDAVAAFAAASLDLNPVHLSEAAARRAGFSGPVLHGMFLAARLETFLERIPGARILAFSVRFVAPALLGCSITLSARLLGQDGHVLHLRLLATSEEGKILAVAEARVLCASHPAQQEG
ncbi:MaoC family dehydratase [Aestuariivirga sp.]|uniref:MaoC family dehydratase n=1 Tax=Aestuariivirga sp. TaxID=2650926 RepID=UPI003BAA352D